MIQILSSLDPHHVSKTVKTDTQLGISLAEKGYLSDFDGPILFDGDRITANISLALTVFHDHICTIRPAFHEGIAADE